MKMLRIRRKRFPKFEKVKLGNVSCPKSCCRERLHLHAAIVHELSFIAEGPLFWIEALFCGIHSYVKHFYSGPFRILRAKLGF